MRSRYHRRRVRISFDGEEEPLEAVVLDTFEEHGSWYYRIRLAEGGAIIDVKSNSINFIAHLKPSVVQLRKRIRIVK